MSTVVTKKKSDRKDKVVLNIQRTLCYIVLILLAILCLFSFYVFGRILWMIYRKLRKIIELRDWQPPAVCDNICVGTFINV